MVKCWGGNKRRPLNLDLVFPHNAKSILKVKSLSGSKITHPPEIVKMFINCDQKHEQAGHAEYNQILVPDQTFLGPPVERPRW